MPPEPDRNPAVLPAPSARTNLVLVGAAVAVGWYGAAYGTSYLWSDSDGAESLRVPVIGPYQALAKTGCGSREPRCETLDVIVRTLLTGFSAVGQVGGLLAMVEGVFLPTGSGARSREERRAQPRRAASRVAAAPRVSVAPVSAGPSGMVLGVVGDF